MKLLALIFSAVAVVAGAPTGSGSTIAVDIVSRAPNSGNPGFYYCKDENFEGMCTYSTTESALCITFAAGDAWIDNISSVRPDIGMTCTLYSEVGCMGTAFSVNDEIASLIPQGWNDLTRSYTCTRR
ncbi:uncharacterized protein BT62DRAFT_1012135 [Guyanagaster necrorhizus]|uniref:Uncharacterized protein n=1 Tax=Guyanagaster necrorhizus TaxID=856835 RepID=A0A9P7VHW4_9AGAR|nr:uncharacterized protein BT62DRAFT_1012135 [Guyanagaster necrorhizus MCA 3950]KAG7440912.1 hypothetical protein BT62DRAFT_1012135 [Guyanagaster necrorhizus MCA 3950]